MSDELARRRALKAEQTAEEARRRQADPDQDEDLPRYGWSDVLAMVIAAYQVIMPVVLLFIGAVVLVYLFFRFVFLR